MEFFSFIRIHLNLHGGKYTKSISLFLFSFVVPFSFFFLFSPLGHKCRMCFLETVSRSAPILIHFLSFFFNDEKTANPKAIKQHPIDHDLCGGARDSINLSPTVWPTSRPRTIHASYLNITYYSFLQGIKLEDTSSPNSNR